MFGANLIGVLWYRLEQMLKSGRRLSGAHPWRLPRSLLLLLSVLRVVFFEPSDMSADLVRIDAELDQFVGVQPLSAAVIDAEVRRREGRRDTGSRWTVCGGPVGY